MKKPLISRIVEAITLVEFIAMVIIVLLQVFFRYVLKLSVPWTEEFARVLYIWVIFLGIVQVETENINIRTTYFIDKLPLCVCRAILIVSNLFSILLMVCLFIGSIILIRTSSVYTLASLPWISSSIFYVPVLICAPATILLLMRQIRLFSGYYPEADKKEEA